MQSASALVELASIYFACRDSDTLLKAFAGRAGPMLRARTVLVWISDSAGVLSCRKAWSEGGRSLRPAESVNDGFLTDLLKSAEPRLVSAADIDPENLTHLDEADRSRVTSALYVPLLSGAGAFGVVEALNRTTGEFSSDDLAICREAASLTAQAYTQLAGVENDRQVQLATLERLTSLYDLSRTFNSTLELNELIPIVAQKIGDLLGAQACNLWLLDAKTEELYLAHQAGEDPSVAENARVPLKEGFLGEIAQRGGPRLVENPAEEPLLEERRSSSGEFSIDSLMCAPLLKETEVVGVVELVNKADGASFSEEDLFFLASVCEQAAVALHNANLLESERKVGVLDALLKISQEISSTLDLDHVLTTVVHQAATVVSFDRCVIAFFDRNRFVIGAVSGETEVPKSREMERMREMFERLAVDGQPAAADQYEDGWKCDPQAAAAYLVPLLEEHDYSGFYGLPLQDEQGKLGLLALLSHDAEFLTANQRETVNILANQTAVAIRNAQLYQQVPLVSVLRPLARRKEKLMSRVPFARWLDVAWKVAVVAVLLIVIPWKMRVGANVTVVPAERRVVSAQVSGVVRRVLVHEGDLVQQDQLLAQLDDSEDRVKLVQAQTSLILARRDLAEAEFRRDLSAASQARLQSQFHEAAAAFEQERVNYAALRSPIAGVVVTPKVEEKTGTLMKLGDPFCELVEPSRMAADINVPEAKMDLIRPGAKVAVKLNTFPTMTFNGAVEYIGARTITAEDEQFFVVRAIFDNPGAKARAGMVGRAKITAGGGWFESGWYPLGYMLFRSPFRWAWKEAWGWLP